MTTPNDEARNQIHTRLQSADLVQATIKRQDDDGTERRITIRPVEIKSRRLLQIADFDGKKTNTQNITTDSSLAEYLHPKLKHVHITLTTEDWQVQFSRKGKPIIHAKTRSAPIQPSLAHDRKIARALPEEENQSFLQTIGLMTADGRIKADRQRKYQQINEFIRLVNETTDLSTLTENELLIVDFGCGNAYLSFGLHHYLTTCRNIPARLIGVDRNAELIATNQQKARDLQSETIEFAIGGIADYTPPRPPEIVVALHACDTATDDALAQGIRARSKLIITAPCCHHHIQAQLDRNATNEAFAPMLRDGIIKERLGDLITDTIRALLLRISGYRVDVIEFISPEHTAKNMMIRAVWSPDADRTKPLAEYETMKRTFGVVPYLESQLPEEIRTLINRIE
jgi:SAM-dependent methyltransferase